MSLDASAVWDKSIDVLKHRLDPQIFTAWIKPLRVAGIEKVDIKKEGGEGEIPLETNKISLLTPNKFSCDHIQRHYGKLISSTVSEITGLNDVHLSFQVGAGLSSEKKNPAHRGFSSADDVLSSLSGSGSLRKAPSVRDKTPSKRRKPDAVTTNTNLNPKYNFSNFVIGGCNQFAHAASLQVSQNLGAQYNPLFIYGGVGLGKTHLVNSIGNTAVRLGKKVRLVSSEDFVNELITALRSNGMQKFRSRYRTLDLLIIDDIQFIIGKERTQEEFFHTFNDLHQRHKQIILTSDTLPQDLVDLEERLRTRFASGLSTDLQAPDFETRVAILIKKAEANSISLEDDVATYLAEKIDTNIRELEGALNRLHAMSALHKSPITLELAQSAISNLISDKPVEVPTEAIQRAVAEKYNVSLSDLVGKRRTQNIAQARHIAMYLCRRLTGCSYPEIGALFGGRDHSTVIHAFRVVSGRVKDNETFREEIGKLERRLQV